VATAGNPASSTIRALITSQAFANIKIGGPECNLLRRSAFSASLSMSISILRAAQLDSFNAQATRASRIKQRQFGRRFLFSFCFCSGGLQAALAGLRSSGFAPPRFLSALCSVFLCEFRAYRNTLNASA
jgi:hypothetical protein